MNEFKTMKTGTLNYYYKWQACNDFVTNYIGFHLFHHLALCAGQWRERRLETSILSLMMASYQGRSQIFKMRGRQGGLRGAYRDSKWWLSIDPCTKCHFISGAQGGLPAGLLTEGAHPGGLTPSQPPGYAPASYLVYAYVACRSETCAILKHVSDWHGFAVLKNVHF